MTYFKNPEQAVDAISTMLSSEAWEKLSRYYDLSDTDIDRASLISGEFFVRKERPELAHPAGFWRIKEPFDPIVTDPERFDIRRNRIGIATKKSSGFLAVASNPAVLAYSVSGLVQARRTVKMTPGISARPEAIKHGNARKIRNNVPTRNGGFLGSEKSASDA